MNLNSVEGILFLSYLTKYNIKAIYQGISLNFDEMETFYLKFLSNNDPKIFLSSKEIENDIINAKKDAKTAIDKIEYYGITTILHNDVSYPSSFKILRDPPPVLFVKGKLKQKNLAAIIGTRNISDHAERITNSIVDICLNLDCGIVSGLALGIDTIAHKRTIEQRGYTIAVLPNSLDTIYPKENYYLANEILQNGGCLISELPIGINRGKKSFVERNRLQSAFSKVIIPIELSSKSGTMHTVNYAKSQKKNLFLIKPSPEISNLPQYEGLLYLISEQKNNPREGVHIIAGVNTFKEKLGSILNNDQFSLF